MQWANGLQRGASRKYLDIPAVSALAKCLQRFRAPKVGIANNSLNSSEHGMVLLAIPGAAHKKTNRLRIRKGDIGLASALRLNAANISNKRIAMKPNIQRSHSALILMEFTHYFPTPHLPIFSI